MAINLTTKRKGLEPQEPINSALNPPSDPMTEMAKKKIFRFPLQEATSTTLNLTKAASNTPNGVVTEQLLEPSEKAIRASFQTELKKAQSLFNQNEFQLALDEIENASIIVPKKSISAYHIIKGECLAALGDHSSALREYYQIDISKMDSGKKAELLSQMARSHIVLRQFYLASRIVHNVLQSYILSETQRQQFHVLQDQILTGRASDFFAETCIETEGQEQKTLNTDVQLSDPLVPMGEPNSQFLPQTPITAAHPSEDNDLPQFINPKDLELQPRISYLQTILPPAKASETTNPSSRWSTKPPSRGSGKYKIFKSTSSIQSLTLAAYHASQGDKFLDAGNFSAAIKNYREALEFERDPVNKGKLLSKIAANQSKIKLSLNKSTTDSEGTGPSLLN